VNSVVVVYAGKEGFDVMALLLYSFLLLPFGVVIYDIIYSSQRFIHVAGW
jgi:hypothetical protein